MTIHSCPECALVHDHGQAPVNAEVEIARINAESALKIAQLSARAEKHVAEVEAEAEVEVAVAETDGLVAAIELNAEEAAIAAEALEGAQEEAPAPAPVNAPVIIDSGNDEVPAPEHHEEHHDEEEAPKHKKSLGLWG